MIRSKSGERSQAPSQGSEPWAVSNAVIKRNKEVEKKDDY